MERLRIKDLYLGKTDAYNEFVSFGKDTCKNLFFEFPSIDIDSVVNGEVYYICGDKGIGKTMLLKYIETIVQEHEEPTFTAFVRFKKDVDDDQRNIIKRTGTTVNTEDTSWDLCDHLCKNLIIKLTNYEEYIFNWITANHIYKRRAAFTLIASAAIHDKKISQDTLNLYLNLIYKNSNSEHEHIKKAASWALREIGKINYEYNEKALLLADAIEQVVMLELHRMAEFLESDEEDFAELLALKTDKELLKEKKQDEAELQKAIARNDTVSHLYEKLYEDNAVGKVSDEWFMQLSHKYETERLELKTKIKALRQKLSECGQREQERKNFTSAIRRFMRMDRLTAPLLRELIDHIDVFETEGKGKNRTQRIVIYYRFVGYVEIPEVSQRPRIKADTRKGVAVEYLTEPLPA